MATPQQSVRTVVGMPSWNCKRVYGELHLMLYYLGSGSIICLQPAVETERLVRSNERQDHRSILFLWTYSHRLRVLGHVDQFVYPKVAPFQPSIIYQQDGTPHTGVCMFEGPSVQHFLINGLDATRRYVDHHVHLTPLDFFLWGYVKDRVFATPVNDIGELRTRIREVVLQ